MSIDILELREDRAKLGEEAFLPALTVGIGAENAEEMIAALADLARREAAGAGRGPRRRRARLSADRPAPAAHENDPAGYAWERTSHDSFSAAS